MSKLYNYYENDITQIFSILELQEQFLSSDNDEQRENGTTFKSWLDENIKMQILIPVL